MGYKGRWDGEWCKRCDRRNVIGWSVPDELWERLVQGRWNILCPMCFDELADEAGIAYDFDQELYPAPWNY